jgi:beta-lactamase class D
VGYSFIGELNDFKEEEITIADMKIIGNFAVYNNGKLRESYSPSTTYEEYKARFVKKLFSNDDQIAIMLNYQRSEDDFELYNKMQEWRDWCGTLAKAIIKLNNK